MPDEPETSAPPAPETAIQQIEAAAEAAIAQVQQAAAAPAAPASDLNQHIDNLWVDLAGLVGKHLPTDTYNAMTSLIAGFRAKVAGPSKEV